MIDHRSYTHNLSSCEIKDKKKIRFEFEPKLCVRSFMHSLVMIIIYWYITKSQNGQLPDGLIAQLIEH